jgi:adenylate cyclase
LPEWLGGASRAAVAERLRLKVCLAALEMARTVDRFNERHPETPLVTHLGLHAGEMVLEYDADGGGMALVGDSANAAQRLQVLNKQLSAGILASDVVVSGLADRLLVRRLGAFELRGIPRPVTVCQIIDRRERAAPAALAVSERFGEALVAFESGQEREALALFERLLAECGPDGPSTFYVERCRQRAGARPPS